MSNSSGESAEALNPLRLDELMLEPLLVGDIAKNPECPDVLPGLVSRGGCDHEKPGFSVGSHDLHLIGTSASRTTHSGLRLNETPLLGAHEFFKGLSD